MENESRGCSRLNSGHHCHILCTNFKGSGWYELQCLLRLLVCESINEMTYLPVPQCTGNYDAESGIALNMQTDNVYIDIFKFISSLNYSFK